MRIVVEPLIKSNISSLISTFCDVDVERLTILDYCQSLGEVYTGFVDGEFICCWGLIPPSFLSNTAYLWMWAPADLKHQFVFIRQSQIQVAKMLEHYDQITGECIVSNHSARRWLKWLGATFDEPHGNVIPFTIRKRLDG